MSILTNKRSIDMVYIRQIKLGFREFILFHVTIFINLLSTNSIHQVHSKILFSRQMALEQL